MIGFYSSKPNGLNTQIRSHICVSEFSVIEFIPDTYLLMDAVLIIQITLVLLRTKLTRNHCESYYLQLIHVDNQFNFVLCPGIKSLPGKVKIAFFLSFWRIICTRKNNWRQKFHPIYSTMLLQRMLWSLTMFFFF